MHKIFLAAWLLAMMVCPMQLSAAEYRLPPVLQRALNQAGVPREAIGVFVQEVGTERPLLAINAERGMNPASTMKVLTTLAALELLGPAYTWRTEAWAAAVLQDGLLEGDLVLKGHGDPKLTLENFWLFLRDLRARGLREIRGDLVLDRSFFDMEQIDPALFDNEPTRPYNVGPDALLVNYKSFRLHFIPEEQTGTVKIIAQPDLPQIAIINLLAMGPGPCEVWPSRPTAEPPTAKLIFAGRFPSGCGEKARSFSLLSPNDYMYALFQQLWTELGGTWIGRVREGTVPDDARLLATWESPALAEVIRDMNKFSNNVMARQLFLTLSLATDNPPASPDKAARALREWLARRQLHFPELVLENGSGLSRNERISARHLAELLAYAQRSALMAEFTASLPLVGVDGTTRRRLTDAPVAGKAHIKTGYLDGVRAIAGFLIDERGRTFIVVSLINHPAAGGTQVFQDTLLEWIYATVADAGAATKTSRSL